MDPPQEDDIKLAVLDILQTSNLEDMTEFKVRSLASERLGTNLNASAHKKLVRKIVEDFLSSKAETGDTEGADEQTAAAEEEQEAEAEPDPQPRRVSSKKQNVGKDRRQSGGGEADQFICQLSNKRNVHIQKFRGKTLVSIREYYERDGELLPTAKGISLTVDQWKTLKSSVSAIENAIKSLQ